jgi:hypothetical protein
MLKMGAAVPRGLCVSGGGMEMASHRVNTPDGLTSEWSQAVTFKPGSGNVTIANHVESWGSTRTMGHSLAPPRH